MPSTDLLDKLIKGGFLEKYPKDTGRGQAEKLLARARRDIKTAALNLEIDEEAAYTFAYLAMLRSGRGLMFLKGYRPLDGRQHMTVVEVTGYFLGPACEDLAFEFERMRRARNQFTYEPDLPLGQHEAEKAVKTAEEFVHYVLEQARKEDPKLNF